MKTCDSCGATESEHWYDFVDVTPHPISVACSESIDEINIPKTHCLSCEMKEDEVVTQFVEWGDISYDNLISILWDKIALLDKHSIVEKLIDKSDETRTTSIDI